MNQKLKFNTLNKNQLNLLQSILSSLICIPRSGNIGYLPKKQFSGFVGYGDWDNNCYDNEIIQKETTYKHWFSILDDDILVPICEFYYPQNVKQGDIITVLCDYYKRHGFFVVKDENGNPLEISSVENENTDLLEVSWVHGLSGLVETKLCWIFCLGCINDYEVHTYPQLSRSEKTKIDRIKTKLLSRLD